MKDASWLKYIPINIRHKLNGKYSTQTIISNSIWYFSEKTIKLILGMFLGVAVARYLGPNQYGLWNYVIAYCSIFSAFATLGLDNVVIRDMVKMPSHQNVLLGTSFILRSISALTAFIAALTLIKLLSPSDELKFNLVAITAAGMLFQSIFVIDSFFQAKAIPKFTVISTTIAFLICSLVQAILLYQSASIFSFAIAAFSEIILASLFLVIAYKKNNQSMFFWKYNSLEAKRMFLDGLPILLSTAVIIFNMRIDQTLLGSMSGNKEVGYYSAAIKLSEVWYLIPVIVLQVIFPKLVEIYHQKNTYAYILISRLFKFALAVSIVGSIFVSLESKTIINIVFGTSYEKASSILSIHIFGGIIVFVGSVWSRWILIENQQKIFLYAHLVTTLVNVSLGVILIPILHAKGAAIAAVLSFYIGQVFGFFLYKPRFLFRMMFMNIKKD